MLRPSLWISSVFLSVLINSRQVAALLRESLDILKVFNSEFFHYKVSERDKQRSFITFNFCFGNLGICGVTRR